MLLLPAAWTSVSLARYGLGRLSWLGHRDVLCRGIMCREILSRETDGPGGQVNLAQKVPQADHQGPGGTEKESADHPGEFRFEQPPKNRAGKIAQTSRAARVVA